MSTSYTAFLLLSSDNKYFEIRLPNIILCVTVQGHCTEKSSYVMYTMHRFINIFLLCEAKDK